MERKRPCTGLGSWRHVTVDEITPDNVTLLPRAFEHMGLPWDWLVNMDGASMGTSSRGGPGGPGGLGGFLGGLSGPGPSQGLGGSGGAANMENGTFQI